MEERVSRMYRIIGNLFGRDEVKLDSDRMVMSYDGLVVTIYIIVGDNVFESVKVKLFHPESGICSEESHALPNTGLPDDRASQYFLNRVKKQADVFKMLMEVSNYGR